MRGALEFLGVNPGLLRTTVQVRTWTIGSDKGNETRTEILFPEDVCNLESLSGRELQSAQVLSAEVQFKLLFRYRPQYKSNMQVMAGARVFEILYPMHDESRHTRTELYCKEVNP